MLPTDRAQTFANAPIEDLLYVVLRQLKRPLETQHESLTDAGAKQLAAQRTSGKQSDSSELVVALIAIVTESESLLERMGLTFIESLDKQMDQIMGWETTAEFLELANEKANAELRITLAAAMALVFGGEKRFASYLLHLANGDYGDETAIVRRVLFFAAGIAPDAPDGLTQARLWLGETN